MKIYTFVFLLGAESTDLLMSQKTFQIKYQVGDKIKYISALKYFFNGKPLKQKRFEKRNDL